MLVGRDREVSELEGVLEQVRSGEGALVLIAGEPGIGKTRLATEATRRARDRGMRATWGQCWEAGGAPALWPWREACEGLGARFPEATAVGDPLEARFALFRDVARVLGQHGPCVVVLEDLHAADRSTLMLLEFVATQLRSLPVLVIGTYRELEASLSEDTSRALGRAVRSGRLLSLARLREAEVAALVRDALENADDKTAATVFEATHGNPLFVGEMVRELRSGHTDRIPLGVREIIRQRLSLISEQARRVLEIGAVVGVEFTAADVVQIDPTAASVLDDATRSGLVVARDHRFRFAHALYRESLYHEAPRARRQELHREVARVLIARAGAAVEIAHHLIEAGSALAIDHAIRAASQSLAVFAFEDATALLERAQAGAHDNPSRCSVMIALGEVRIRSGDAAGRALCASAAQLARELGDPQLLARAGLAYGAVFLMGGVDPVLVAMLEEALSGLTNDTLRARVMARLAAARQPSPPAERQRDIDTAFAAIELARRVAEPPELLEVLHAASGVLYGAVAPKVRIQISREQERLAEQLGNLPLLVHARTRLAYDHLELADFAGHAELATTYEAMVERVGPAAGPWRVPLMRSMQAIAANDFAASERWQTEARRLDHEQPRARRAIAFHRICFLRASERHAELRAALPELRGLWLQMPYGKLLADARVVSCLARIGAEEEARALLATIPIEALHEEINSLSLVDALWLLGDPTHAAMLQRSLEPDRWGDRWGAYWFDLEIVEGPCTRPAAYLAALLGDWQEAERLHARALRDVEAARFRNMAARMRFELGDLMLRLDRDPPRARALISEARALAAAGALAELVALIDRRHGDAPKAPSTRPRFSLSLEGEYYAVPSAKGTLRFKASRGMQYLAALVERPRVDIHVLELVGSESADRGDAGELLDPEAFRSYRARLETLRESLEHAEAIGDSERAEHIRDEMETIAAELSRSSGKGGRSRRAESSVDRARSAVQRRIKDALDRIAEQDAELGKWLRRAVRTGNHCSFHDDSD